jgi:starch phosphorylase
MEKGSSMSTRRAPLTSPASSADLLRQYGCGPIPFVGTENGFYERHLVFDRVINPKVATARERFDAVSRSVRDILTQRWVLTKETYDRENPKRVYYLSMEFLLGRSLANNVTNLLLDPLVRQAVREKSIDWLELLEQEPDAGLERRSGASCSMLSRLHGHHAASRGGLWSAL